MDDMARPGSTVIVLPYFYNCRWNVLGRQGVWGVRVEGEAGKGGRMSIQIYGYIRVSSRDQSEDRQRIAMHEAGVPPEHVYRDKQSGKDFKRPGYRRMIRKLQPGDTLIIKSIDRLGRNYEEILEQWRVITKEKCADIVVLDMPLLDTRRGRDLMGTLIADIVLQLLSYVAQTERDFIRQRQAEGIAAAKARGVRFGRPAKARPKGFDGIRLRWLCGEINSRAAAEALGVSQKTFLKWASELV